VHRCCLFQVALAAAIAPLLVCAATSPRSREAKGGPRLVALRVDLPRAVPIGTKRDFKPNEHQEPFPVEGKVRPPFLAPEGTKNVALGKPVTGSDDMPAIGELSLVTDGDKSGNEGTYVELGPGRQWVQIDLQAAFSLHAILVWHYHKEPRYYHDVVVQVSDDADFITNVRTLFDNDYDNSSGLGLGKDKEYAETYEGRLIPVKDTAARFVRLYSKGSSDNDLNHYVEVEVHATPTQ